MFGLAASMSFGFGSFLASAAPQSTNLGTKIDGPNYAYAEITLGIDNTQENGRARLTFRDFTGKKLHYISNTPQGLIDSGTPSITLDNGTGNEAITPSGGDTAITPSSILTWSNGNSPDAQEVANLGFSNLNVWVRAVEQGSVSSGALTNNPNATNWIQIVQNGTQQFDNLNNLTRTLPGTYDFYYYVEGSPFGTNTTTGNGKIIEDSGS